MNINFLNGSDKKMTQKKPDPKYFDTKLTLKKAKQRDWAKYGNYYINKI